MMDAYMKYGDIIDYERRDAAKTAMLNAKIQDICKLLEDYGTISDELMNTLNSEKDLKVLAK